jgi:sarcosine oxidase subunit alpha
MSGGFAPSVHLFSQSRGRLTWSDAARAFVPSRPPSASVRPAPAAASTASQPRSPMAGRGLAAAEACGFAGRTRRYS